MESAICVSLLVIGGCISDKEPPFSMPSGRYWALQDRCLSTASDGAGATRAQALPFGTGLSEGGRTVPGLSLVLRGQIEPRSPVLGDSLPDSQITWRDMVGFGRMRWCATGRIVPVIHLAEDCESAAPQKLTPRRCNVKGGFLFFRSSSP